MSFTNSVLSPGMRGSGELVGTDGLTAGNLVGAGAVPVPGDDVSDGRPEAMTVGTTAARMTAAAPISATARVCGEGNPRGLLPVERTRCGGFVTRDVLRLLMLGHSPLRTSRRGG